MSGYNWPDPTTDPSAYSTFRPVGSSPYSAENLTPGTDYILFIHGWRMTPGDRLIFDSTAYKRLFWQGYKGRFGVFNWPTEWVDTSDKAEAIADGQNYDRSEDKAWHSAGALEQLLSELDDVYGYDHVNMVAHSMGNVVASEALRIAGSTKVVHTYIPTQAATVAEAYDPNAPQTLFNNLYLWTAAGGGAAYRGRSIYASFPGGDGAYFSTIGNAADSIYNFYNPLDFATIQDSSFPYTWRLTQATKPDSNVQFGANTADYGWDGQNFYRTSTTVAPDGSLVTHRQVLSLSNAQDRYDIFSFAAQPESQALGAQGGLGGPITGSVDLSSAAFGFSNLPWDHSAEFTGTNAERASYWRTLITKFGVFYHG